MGTNLIFVCTEKTNTHTLDFFQQEASYPSSRNQVFEQSYLYISTYINFSVFSEKAKMCFCVREKNDQEEELIKVKKKIIVCYSSKKMKFKSLLLLTKNKLVEIKHYYY